MNKKDWEQIDEDNEYILLSVKSNLLKISLAIKLSRTRPMINPAAYNVNEFLFFVSISTPFPRFKNTSGHKKKKSNY